MTQLKITDQSKTDSYEIVSADRNFGAKRAKLFLHFLSESGRIRQSAQSAGFKDAGALYYRKRHDAAFSKAWEAALDTAGDRFEDEAVRRGVEGVDKDVYYKGEVVGQERVYSDGLLGKLLDGAKREKYAPKKDNNTQVNIQVGLAVVPMTNPGLEDWEKGSIEMHGAQSQIIDATFEEVPAPQQAPAGTRTVRT